MGSPVFYSKAQGAGQHKVLSEVAWGLSPAPLQRRSLGFASAVNFRPVLSRQWCIYFSENIKWAVFCGKGKGMRSRHCLYIYSNKI